MKYELEGFFAVTKSPASRSLYKVSTKNGRPVFEKIALAGESNVPTGRVEKEADFLGITRHYGLVLYLQEYGPFSTPKRQRLEDVNASHLLFNTSQVVGLFILEEGARACFAASDLLPWDPRWELETRDTVEAIGDDHSVFVLSNAPDPLLRERKGITP